MSITMDFELKSAIFTGVVVFTFLFSCEKNDTKHSQLEKLQEISDIKGLPKPEFDRLLIELVKSYRVIYDAKEVRIGRPFRYSSGSDTSYWIKIEFLNPELNGKTFREFGADVARNTLSHLTNYQDFEKIEVSMAQKRGFILSFTKNENAFFYIDSLRAKPN